MKDEVDKISSFDFPNDINGNKFSDDFSKIIDKNGNILYDNLSIPRFVLNKIKKDFYKKRKSVGMLKNFSNMVKKLFSGIDLGEQNASS